MLCYNELAGDLLEIELRNGAADSSMGVAYFIHPLVDEYFTKYPKIGLFLRGDSGFHKQFETDSVFYATRLKANKTLYVYVKHLEDEIAEVTEENMIDYIIPHDKFKYKASK